MNVARWRNHFEKKRVIYLVAILLLCFFLRFRFIDLCDVDDRGQVVLGMTNNLPPLFHYISVPFLYLADNLWYSPAFGNLLLAVLTALIVYFIGKELKDASFGLLLAFLFAIFPPAILVARFVSPEQTELFSVILITYLFIRLEVTCREEKRQLFTFLYFISIVIGAFSKQQTLFILLPILIFGLYKHRLGIFKREVYYISAFATAPYIFFLLAHPEMLSAVVIYFIQPTGQLSFSYKAISVLGAYVSEALPFLILLLVYFLLSCYSYYAKRRRVSFQSSSIFIIILLLSYHLFIIKTLPNYFYLATLPIIYFTAKAILLIKKDNYRYAVLILFLLYCLISSYFVVPGFSINTYQHCEQNILGIEQNWVFDKLHVETSSASNFFQETSDDIHALLSGEKYLLIGGNTGQDFKYNIKKRMYYAGVMNSERYKDINYALLVYPIDKTYTGAEAWDYSYVTFLLNHSDIVMNESYARTRLIMLRITNHSTEELNVSEFRERSSKSLRLGGTVLSSK